MSDDTKLDLDADLVRKMAKLLEETGLREIEYSEGEKRIRVSNGPAAPTEQIPAANTNIAGGATAPAAPLNGKPVTSPMVGTVYLAPEPGKPPFIKKGDTVKEGDTLLIIEAMKVMNPIKAPAGGTISEIMVGDSKPVEFGETLLLIA